MKYQEDMGYKSFMKFLEKTGIENLVGERVGVDCDDDNTFDFYSIDNNGNLYSHGTFKPQEAIGENGWAIGFTLPCDTIIAAVKL